MALLVKCLTSMHETWVDPPALPKQLDACNPTMWELEAEGQEFNAISVSKTKQNRGYRSSTQEAEPGRLFRISGSLRKEKKSAAAGGSYVRSQEQLPESTGQSWVPFLSIQRARGWVPGASSTRG